VNLATAVTVGYRSYDTSPSLPFIDIMAKDCSCPTQFIKVTFLVQSLTRLLVLPPGALNDVMPKGAGLPQSYFEGFVASDNPGRLLSLGYYVVVVVYTG